MQDLTKQVTVHTYSMAQIRSQAVLIYFFSIGVLTQNKVNTTYQTTK
jgi:hypothetical protein